LLPALFDGRVWAFNHETAHWYGELLLRRREQLGRPIAMADAVIPAITWPRKPSWLPATWPNSQGSAWC
jgi:hypothetical protein